MILIKIIINIKARVCKGRGAVKQITQMLSDLFLGPYYYEAFSVLRLSLLLSSLISNSESLVGLTKKQITELESVDEELFRNIFSCEDAALEVHFELVTQSNFTM